MARLEKLSIKGIRSYYPDGKAVLTFENNLNLIYGCNGSGKTTILECIKLIFTGSFPPGTRLANFTSDLKQCKSNSVKAAVELTFFDENDTKCTAKRGMLTQLKHGKVESKTVESCLDVEEIKSMKRNISSRSGDFTREISAIVGASRALLEHVILCHHDDSYWPLTEAKILKERLDEIFATAHYNKALEVVRAVRRSKAQKLPEIQIEAERLRQISAKAREIEERLLQTNNELEQKGRQIEKLNKQSQTYSSEINELKNRIQDINVIQRQIDELKLLSKRITVEIEILSVDLPPLSTDQLQNLDSLLEQNKHKLVQKETFLHELQLHIEKKRGKLAHANAKLNEELCRSRSLDTKLQDVLMQYHEMCELLGAPPLAAPQRRLETVSEHLENCYQSHKASIEATLSEKEAKLSCSNRELESRRSKLQLLLIASGRVESDITSLNASEEGVKQQLVALENKIQKIKNENASAGELEDHLLQKNQQLSTLLNTQNRHTINKTILELEEDIISLEALRSTLETKREELNQELAVALERESAEEQLEKLLFEVNTLISVHKKVLKRIDSNVVNSSKALEETISKLTTCLTQTESEFEKAQHGGAQKEAELVRIRESLSEKQNLMRQIEKDLDRLAGFLLKNDISFDLAEIDEKLSTVSKKMAKYDTLASFHRKAGKAIASTHMCPVCHSSFEATPQCVTEKIGSKIDFYGAKAVLYKERYGEFFAKRNVQQEHCERLEKRRALLEHQTALSEEITIVKERLSSLETELVASEQSLSQIVDFKAKVYKTVIDMTVVRKTALEIDRLKSKLSTSDVGRPVPVLRQEFETLSIQLDEKTKSSSSLKERLISQRNALICFSEQKARLSEEICLLMSRKSTLKSCSALIDEYDSQKNTLSEERSNFRDRITKIKSRGVKKRAKCQGAEEAVLRLSAEIEASKSQCNAECFAFQLLCSKIDSFLERLNECLSEKLPNLVQESTKKTQSCLHSIERTTSRIDQLINLQKTTEADVVNIKTLIDSTQRHINVRKVEQELAEIESKINALTLQLTQLLRGSDLQKELEEKTFSISQVQNNLFMLKGGIAEMSKLVTSLENDLNSPPYFDSNKILLKKLTELKATAFIVSDLDRYYGALDRAITKYHQTRLAQLNRIIGQYWSVAYQSDDIDTIELVSEADEEESKFKERRSYNYRVVMVKGDSCSEMRGRCSSGQKTIASIIIRLALFRTFCRSCAFIALDEPTTNLDEANIKGLADSLRQIASHRSSQGPLQLLVITHDDKFLQHLCHGQDVRYYFETFKNEYASSVIAKKKIESLCS